MSKTCKNFLITKNLNEKDKIDCKSYLENMFNCLGCRYLCGQLEKGKSGNIHYQFFINFKQSVRPSKIQKVDKALHIEYVYRNNGADSYCLKEDTRVDGPYEFGSKPVRRNSKEDWEEVWNLAKEGKLEEIDPCIRIKHYSNLTKIKKDNLTSNLTDSNHLRGIWIYGEAGSGKSRWCRENCPNLYPKLCNKWWDGYDGQKYVVMDDIMPCHSVLAQQLKIWTDRYGCILETKGGAVVSNYDWFIVTSQYTIKEIFQDSRDYEAIKRRFQEYYIDDIHNLNLKLKDNQSD